MMVRGSCWLWLGFPAFGQLNFTGGSPGSRALCLFSLHKDFHRGRPLWQRSCISSPLVPLPCRKIHSLHVASCDVGSGPASGQSRRSLACRSTELPPSPTPGDWKHSFLSLNNRPLLIATPDRQSQTLIWMMGEISRMFSLTLLWSYRSWNMGGF